MNARAAWALTALMALGCGQTFTPDSLVNSFRVLAIKADAPELHPGDTTALHPLVFDPTPPDGGDTLVWIGCDPDPLALDRSACSDLGNLQSAAALAANVDGGSFVLPAGMEAIGYDTIAQYSAPANTFSSLAPTDPRRKSGSLADMLVIAAAGYLSIVATDAQKTEFFTEVENAEIPAVLILDRVVISEETILNQNPVLGDLLVDGTPLPDGGTFRLLRGATSNPEMTAPDSSFELYQETQPDGTVSQRQEKLVAAFYATTGSFSLDRVALRSGTPLTFTAPAGTSDDPVPSDGYGTMWVVVRDTRGGLNWNQYPLFVCDPSLPAPSVTAISPTSGPADGNTLLSVSGMNLEDILDVMVGDAALRTSRPYSILHNSGLVPPLPSGTYPITLRAKDCQDYPTGLFYQVP